jgi:signal transduction histidine kinase
LETAEGLLITAAIRDITERKNAEQALKALELQIMHQRIQEQKRITRAIISAQEQERNRIGQELHDNICQIISTAKLYITVAKEDKPELSEIVDYPIELIETAIKEIRVLSERNVTPLKDIDLEDMVQTLVGNLARTTSLKTNLAYQVADHIFDDGLKLNTYRLIQEQLNNIVKHAGAKKVNVSIESEDHFVHVAVSDDGKGFDINQKRSGIGISNMINRVESYNGEIRIESSPGSGCTIRCKFPF